MAGIFDGLKSLGLGKLENSDLFADDEPKKESKVERPAPKKAVNMVKECDLVFDKEFKCPVCDKSFSAKIMKSGRTRLVGTDDDLRPKYDGIDSQKYDVILCENCGYAALGKSFPNVLASQVKLIKDNICSSVKLTKYVDPIYTYEQAAERYKLALACALVKKAKNSEKALICLKSAWLFRGQREEMEIAGEDKKKIDSLLARENEYLENAYRGFIAAREKENTPIAGMDSVTLDYLLARLAFRFEEYDNASKLVGGILLSSSNDRIKNKARELKEEILAKKSGR